MNKPNNKASIAFLLFFLIAIIGLCSKEIKHEKIKITHTNNTYKTSLSLMGSRFEIIVVHNNKDLAHKSIHAAIKKIQEIENNISSWIPSSLTSKINQAAGKSPIKVDKEYLNFIGRCKMISKLTDGVFDISFASVDKHWSFKTSMAKLPDPDALKRSVRLINYKKILINKKDSTIFLEEKGMKIGFGAIGKGYAANHAKKLLFNMGIKSGIVNAGGDLFAWGTQDTGKPWKIKITHPNHTEKAISWLSLSDTAIVTSGNYEKYVIIDGKRYCHIINPKTGYPVSGIKSVTIITPDAELADALATSVFILGKEKGLALINSLNHVEGFLIDENLQILKSDKMKINEKDQKK